MARSHGTTGCYDAGCKCDPCTDANNDRAEAARASRAQRDPKVHNASTYRNWPGHGQNCTVCRDDYRRMLRERNAAAGRGKNRRKPWTSAEMDLIVEKSDGRRYRYTALQLAHMLGRSVAAVNQQRSTKSQGRVKSGAGAAAPGGTIPGS